MTHKFLPLFVISLFFSLTLGIQIADASLSTAALQRIKQMNLTKIAPDDTKFLSSLATGKQGFLITETGKAVQGGTFYTRTVFSATAQDKGQQLTKMAAWAEQSDQALQQVGNRTGAHEFRAVFLQPEQGIKMGWLRYSNCTYCTSQQPLQIKNIVQPSIETRRLAELLQGKITGSIDWRKMGISELGDTTLGWSSPNMLRNRSQLLPAGKAIAAGGNL